MMKRMLVAATTTLVMQTATAQVPASITLYGLMDAGIGYTRLSGAYKDPATGRTLRAGMSRLGALSGGVSGPRWGVRGKEDLGDGLHAVFQLESGFDSRNGQILQGGRLFGRQATVGLTDARWGELRLGRQYNAATRYFLNMLGPAFGGFSQLHTGYGLGMSSASFPRYDNQVFYETPSMGGIKAAAGYAFSVNDTRNAETGYATANNTRAITAALQYARGPLSAFLGYDQLNAARQLGTARAAATPRAYIIGASYDFIALKIAMAYNRVADGWFAGRSFRDDGRVGGLAGTPSYAFSRGLRSNSHVIALAVPAGLSGHAFASWQRTDINSSRLTGGDATGHTYSLGYSHNLSKRTDLYAVVSHTRNWAFVDGVRALDAYAGLRHRF
ncbi:porin [Achromobacter sp. Marseille-Q0513]|uniref:porin n=1 Tax=Achromobacter sp. Marseille-Q0513 TaxID=2829161 RepID=UPI0032C454CF